MASTEAKLNDLELKVYDLIRLKGWEGKTCDEIEAETGLTHQSASARVSELENRHKLIERRSIRRKTRAGRQARVYVVKGLPEAAKRIDA